MPSRSVVLVTAALIFVSGIAVGQRQALGRFSKYSGATPNLLAFELLSAEVDAIHESIPTSRGFGVPSFRYDQKKDKFIATFVGYGDIKTHSIETAKEDLMFKSASAIAALNGVFPEVRETDVEVRFVIAIPAKDGAIQVVPFADWYNGKVEFH